MAKTNETEEKISDVSGEDTLHGKTLTGSEQAHAKRNPDTTLHLDGEKDSLYDDGLDVEDDSETLADTRNSNHRG